MNTQEAIKKFKKGKKKALAELHLQLLRDAHVNHKYGKSDNEIIIYCLNGIITFYLTTGAWFYNAKPNKKYYGILRLLTELGYKEV